MMPATRSFIMRRFSDYYENGILKAPSSTAQREFGFIHFSDAYPDEIFMKRHIGFFSADEMETYIRNMVPAHAYYSTAYYENPAAPTMQQKGWSGADLIFDLDADHIMRGSYEAMLDRVKQEAIRLLELLTGELGIDTKTIGVVFSGGRGYHIHITDAAFRTWTGPERREIIDYVCGIGISPKAMLSRFQPETAGWPLRFRDTLYAYLISLSSRDGTDNIAELTSYDGIGEIRAARFASLIPDICSRLQTDPHSINTDDQTIATVLHALCSDQKGRFYTLCREAGILADEPVTTDIKRLIRLPGSLHAKSGFRVVSLSIRELHDFNPLVDAVVWNDRDLMIESKVSYDITLLENRYHIVKGVHTVPEALGLFLCCRGMAEVAGGR